VERVASITSALAVLQDRPATERDYAIEGRATEMMAALQVFLDNPVIGVGPGQYMPFYSVEYQQKNPRLKFSDLRIPRRAHSLYLELGAELGLVGLVVFLGIVGTVLRELWRARNHWRGKVLEHTDLATALFLALAGYLTTGVFLHLMYERYFWLLLAVGGAVVQVLRRLQTDEIGPDLAFAPTPAASELARLSTEG
jgi:O-antigen ligase